MFSAPSGVVIETGALSTSSCVIKIDGETTFANHTNIFDSGIHDGGKERLDTTAKQSETTRRPEKKG